MEGKTRADDQQIFPAQLPQCPPSRRWSSGRRPVEQGELDTGNICLGIHDFQGDEQPVIKTPPVVQAGGNTIIFEEPVDAPGQSRLAWSGVGNGVGLLGETVIVVKEGWGLPAGNGGERLFPMGADHHNCRGSDQGSRDLLQKFYQFPVPRLTEQRQRAAAVGEIDDRAGRFAVLPVVRWGNWHKYLSLLKFYISEGGGLTQGVVAWCRNIKGTHFILQIRNKGCNGRCRSQRVSMKNVDPRGEIA